MDAFEFCKEFGRMCKFYYTDCEGCPMNGWNTPIVVQCADMCDLTEEQIQEKIEIVEKWSKEHPKKTMAMDFFEKFPNAPSNNGVPICCPSQIYENKNSSCDKNCEKCWNRLLEE